MATTSVDEYIQNHSEWKPLIQTFRQLLNDCGLQETIKWGAPTFTLNGKNLVGIGAFKQHCGLWFFQGALLSDPKQVLTNAQEQKTKALRQWRFVQQDKIPAEDITAYVQEAIALAKQGKEIKPQRNITPIVIPQELQDALEEDAQLAEAFQAFTPSKQREFAEHIGTAKRDATRLTRLQKAIPMIKAGTGLNDKYRNC